MATWVCLQRATLRGLCRAAPAAPAGSSSTPPLVIRSFQGPGSQQTYKAKSRPNSAKSQFYRTQCAGNPDQVWEPKYWEVGTCFCRSAKDQLSYVCLIPPKPLVSLELKSVNVALSSFQIQGQNKNYPRTSHVDFVFLINLEDIAIRILQITHNIGKILSASQGPENTLTVITIQIFEEIILEFGGTEMQYSY